MEKNNVPVSKIVNNYYSVDIFWGYATVEECGLSTGWG